jgi:small GTP-binding protein
MTKKQERQYAPDEVNHYGEYIKIGGSPGPGITLRNVFHGHKKAINRIAWSPDGRYLASPSDDETIRIWDVENGQCMAVLDDTEEVLYVAWSPNQELLASISGSEPYGGGALRIWNTKSWQTVYERQQRFRGLSWSPDGNRLVFASRGGQIQLLDIEKGKFLDFFGGHDDFVNDIVWSPISDDVASASGIWDKTNKDNTIRIWDTKTKKQKQILSGHYGGIYGIAWMPDGRLIISGSVDHSIRLWDSIAGKQVQILEGHTNPITSVSLSSDGTLLASRSLDNHIFLWRTDTWGRVANYLEKATNKLIAGLAFNPRFHYLASLGDDDRIVRIWDIDFNALISNEPANESIRYTTAKLVLVGDSGVGKTGLGWRLAHNEFKEHSSTHGQQFWVIPALGLKRYDGTECEAVLWDLAGQPDYRLVHSLYLDDVDTALVLFDPTNRQEPLSEVNFWLNQLKDKDKKLRNAILVGARNDRGTSTLTDAEIQAYCERNGISGGYIPTSALNGNGLPELLEKLKTQIPWDQMTTTVTTATFKKIKEFVLALKEKPKRDYVLVQPAELRKQLQATDRNWGFSDAEMMTAVGHLENHGFVKVIHSSNGEHSFLLAPDILANLASSVVLEARRNPRGLGVLEEERLLRGDYPFLELNTLSEDESKILLDAVAVLFLERNLCFRETFNNQTFLVFPSLINEKRPIDENIKLEEGASYRVKGAVENVYASLVVLLGYTNTFTRTHQWQNQAQYEMGEDEICGFIQSEYRKGEIELVIYYDQKTPDPVRLTFRGLFERFLTRRELEISRYQPVTCHKCDSPLARNVVLDQLSRGKNFSFCHECGEKLLLPDPEPISRFSRREEIIMDVQQAVAQRRTAFEAALVRVKGLLRDQEKEKAPTCFISYSWGVHEHERWVVQFAKDLRNAGIDVLLDRWHSPPGSDLGCYIDQIMKSDFVAVVGTPQLLKKYQTQQADPVVAAELRLINVRLREPSVYGQTIIPLLLDGDVRSSFIPMMQTLVRVDFKQSAFYFRELFDMIWRMYHLPFDNPLLEELQASMTPQETA